MPSELESQLERALAALPPSSDASREQARRTALDALGEKPPRHRRFVVKALVAVAAVVCVMTAGVTLAASGHIDIPLLQPETTPPPTTPSTSRQARSPLPAGSVALVVTIGGRVWSAGPHAAHARPGTLSDISLSPGALYTLEAQGHRLRAVETASGRVAFSHHVEGRVTAAAWSPLPIRIAYLEQVGGTYHQHSMWGTGSHDRRLPGLAARSPPPGAGTHSHSPTSAPTAAPQSSPPPPALPRPCRAPAPSNALKPSPTHPPAGSWQSQIADDSRSSIPPGQAQHGASPTPQGCHHSHGLVVASWRSPRGARFRSRPSDGPASQPPATNSADRSPRLPTRQKDID